MAQAQLENDDRLFFRRPEWNTWSVLNAREEFAQARPDLVRRVLTVYETARHWAVAHPADLKTMLSSAMKLPEPVVASQLARTDLSSGAIGAKPRPQRSSRLADSRRAGHQRRRHGRHELDDRSRLHPRNRRVTRPAHQAPPWLLGLLLPVLLTLAREAAVHFDYAQGRLMPPSDRFRVQRTRRHALRHAD